MSMLARSPYETFIADYLTLKGYFVTTDVRYRRLKGKRLVSSDLDILAIPVYQQGDLRPIIGEVYAYTLKSRDTLQELLNKLTEGELQHNGRKIGLGSLLKELGFKDLQELERHLYAWAIGGTKLPGDEILKIAREQGVKIITFKEVLDDLIRTTRSRIEREEWFEPRNLTQAVVALILHFQRYFGLKI